MAKRGRKLIPIDKEQFEKLCYLQCTLVEISGWFECSEDTIERWCKRIYKLKFAEIRDKKRSKGKIAIRRKQMQVAESGNVSMLIWLGKQYLNQKEKNDLSSDQPININYKVISKQKIND